MKRDTKLVTLGRPSERHQGPVNVPVYRASTILFPTLDAFEATRDPNYPGLRYGRFGTPSSHAFEETVAGLEGAEKAVALPSGKAAICAALLSHLKAGDHVLITDSAYGPTRRFAEGPLRNFGVETTFYDPYIGDGIAELLRPNTRIVYVESPGSLTFEVQDIPAIAKAAHRGGAVVIADNTWATPLYCRPLELGADLVLHAATKYMVGHSDAVLGVIAGNGEAIQRARAGAQAFAYSAGPDDCFLGLRGLRTLSVRLPRHQASGLELARWLAARPEVARVLHPGLPGNPEHALWRRDFTGASGLFSIVLKPVPRAAVAAMLDGLELFGMGASWGGFESLILLQHPQTMRTATVWSDPGPVLRLHAGLEDPSDLIADLEAGLVRLAAKAKA
jgi:cysteine-S-conjugate beta-lyase